MANKIIVIVGQTSSGKTDLSVELAKKFNGEVISADSRQVYKGLDVGSGKVTKNEMKGIPHYLLDITSPNRAFSINQFKNKADKAIKDILKRGKIPIIAGGTGFYIQAIVDNIVLPEVKPNLKLRKELEALIPKKTKSQKISVYKKNKEEALKELVKRLRKLDPRRLEEIDQKNPRRLIRAIEIATELGRVPKLESPAVGQLGGYEFLQIGIEVDKGVLGERIEKRFRKRVRTGIVAEAKRLHEKGMSWKRMNEIGLAHKYIAKYLKGEISKENMIENSIIEEKKYAKRQKTWFKRDKRIVWFKYEEQKGIEKEIRDFLST
ncbi:tRNA (adenosine(37)-N6)-dimethylallyltransferase MiaA [Patescibacteria group bacterium]|nr:tRNA (adenosine(37)-N6)-dimethylallyltransferase MiaA [Patescibacteria group bacterium]